MHSINSSDKNKHIIDFIIIIFHCALTLDCLLLLLLLESKK